MQTRFTNLVFQDGLDRIPDEILACIFESGHDMVNHPFFSLNVSHVCRRFRDVALKTPLLWTRIHGNVNLIPTFLARSGKLDLDISFPYSSSQANDKYFNVVKLHSDRWSHLRLDYPPFSLRSRLGLLGSLPRLRFLQCLNATSTFRLPNMPSLVHFKGDTITLPQSPLVICELTLYLNFDPAQLISALYQLKNLRRLSISFNNISAQSRVEDAPIYQPEFALQSLFLSSTSQTPSKIIPRLCSVLPFHPISKLTVAVSGNCVKDLWMDDDDFPTESCDILTRVLRGTGAHTISIESSVASFIPRDATAKSANEALWSTYASLRKLRLKNCDELREWQVKALADNLVSSEVGKGLQSLEILSCENISEGFLLNLGDTMGRKLTWVL
ncbi:hypothetical protein BD410DRAFT_827337 [Rickenella mellea]|uniref:F-box domain-containing protein n=1 Tax=Rickenella mellea TaxID=50990 RepID=A0A4Y7QC33_9AGAM|nr:hypothetical protein BD410DRAFT_827337 [Rickenella mellea]